MGTDRSGPHSGLGWYVMPPAASADQQKYVPISQLAAYSPTSAVQ